MVLPHRLPRLINLNFVHISASVSTSNSNPHLHRPASSFAISPSSPPISNLQPFVTILAPLPAGIVPSTWHLPRSTRSGSTAPSKAFVVSNRSNPSKHGQLPQISWFRFSVHLIFRSQMMRAFGLTARLPFLASYGRVASSSSRRAPSHRYIFADAISVSPPILSSLSFAAPKPSNSVTALSHSPWPQFLAIHYVHGQHTSHTFATAPLPPSMVHHPSSPLVPNRSWLPHTHGSKTSCATHYARPELLAITLAIPFVVVEQPLLFDAASPLFSSSFKETGRATPISCTPSHPSMSVACVPRPWQQLYLFVWVMPPSEALDGVRALPARPFQRQTHRIPGLVCRCARRVKVSEQPTGLFTRFDPA
jgi:hypothetical protein